MSQVFMSTRKIASGFLIRKLEDGYITNGDIAIAVNELPPISGGLTLKDFYDSDKKFLDLELAFKTSKRVVLATIKQPRAFTQIPRNYYALFVETFTGPIFMGYENRMEHSPVVVRYETFNRGHEIAGAVRPIPPAPVCSNDVMEATRWILRHAVDDNESVQDGLRLLAEYIGCVGFDEGPVSIPDEDVPF
jgi:hypothetical protein